MYWLKRLRDYGLQKLRHWRYQMLYIVTAAAWPFGRLFRIPILSGIYDWLNERLLIAEWNDKEQVIKAVSERGYELKKASDELKADREVVMAAVQNDGAALEYASDGLKADREIVLAAVKKSSYPCALQYASDTLRADREIVLAAIQNIMVDHPQPQP